jgi:hypothetical protein
MIGRSHDSLTLLNVKDVVLLQRGQQLSVKDVMFSQRGQQFTGYRQKAL